MLYSTQQDPQQSLQSVGGDTGRIGRAEEAFVAADFKNALHLSNAVLLESVSSARETGSGTSSPAKVFLPKDDFFPWPPTAAKPKSVSVDAGRRHQTKTDRILAVALQSWFEISSLSNTDGKIHLEPFCRILITVPISLDLLSLFLEVCVKLGETGLATSMSLSLYAQCAQFSCSNSLGNDVDVDLLREVWDFTFLRLLPYSLPAVQKVIEMIESPSGSGSKDFGCIPNFSTEKQNVHGIRLLLSFLKEAEGDDWLYLTAQEYCRRLQNFLAHDEKTGEVALIETREHQGSGILSLLRCTVPLDLSDRVSKFVSRMKDFWRGNLNDRNTLAVSMLCIAMLVFRYRKQGPDGLKQFIRKVLSKPG